MVGLIAPEHSHRMKMITKGNYAYVDHYYLNGWVVLATLLLVMIAMHALKLWLAEAPKYDHDH